MKCTKCGNDYPPDSPQWTYRFERRQPGVTRRYRVPHCHNCINKRKREREQALYKKRLSECDTHTEDGVLRKCKVCGETKQRNNDNFRRHRDGVFSYTCWECLLQAMAKTVAERPTMTREGQNIGDDFAVLGDEQLQSIHQLIAQGKSITARANRYVKTNLNQGKVTL